MVADWGVEVVRTASQHHRVLSVFVGGNCHQCRPQVHLLALLAALYSRKNKFLMKKINNVNHLSISSPFLSEEATFTPRLVSHISIVLLYCETPVVH